MSNTPMIPRSKRYSDKARERNGADILTADDALNLSHANAMVEAQSRHDRALGHFTDAAVVGGLPDSGLIDGQGALADRTGCGSYAPKYVFVHRVLRALADPSGDHPKVRPTDIERITAHAADHDVSAADLADLAVKALSPEGAVRVPAVIDLTDTFRSVNAMYLIARPKVEPTPEQGEDEGDEQPEPDGDDEQPTPSVSGEELIARGIRKCREQGMSDADIMTLVMTLQGQ